MGAGFNEIIGGSASVGPSGSGFDTDATDEERYEADLRTLCEEMYDIIDTDHLEIELRLALERSGKTYKDQSIPLDMAIRWLWMSECSSVDRALRVSNDFAASDEGRRVLGVSSTGDSIISIDMAAEVYAAVGAFFMSRFLARCSGETPFKTASATVLGQRDIAIAFTSADGRAAEIDGPMDVHPDRAIEYALYKIVEMHFARMFEVSDSGALLAALRERCDGLMRH